MGRLAAAVAASLILIVVGEAVSGLRASGGGSQEVDVALSARAFAFSPPRFRAKVGDRLTFHIRSHDITHGFAVDGTEVNATVLPGREVRVTVPVDRPGKIRYRCSVVCGPLHPFMVGEIVVEPNPWPTRGGLLAIGVALVAGAGARWPGRGVDMLGWRPIRWLLGRRVFQFAVIAPNLAAFTLIVLAGLVGTETGAMNAATIFVWLAWWGLLVLVLVPLGGRAWCAMCPIPAPGEWLARRAIVDRAQRALGLGWKWPRRLENVWPAFGGLLALVLVGVMVTTRPRLTAALLLGLALVAVVTHLVFERRVFCRYLCPVGGLLGIYSMASPLELRARDLGVCRGCREKACFRGGATSYPCPTFQFPGGGLLRNNYCILCTECVKACPYGNLSLRIRPPGTDLLVDRGRRADEAWTVLLLLGTALAHSVIKLGPWGWIKSWASGEEAGPFFLYAALFVAGVLVVLPALHLLGAWLSRTVAGAAGVAVGDLFVTYAYALVPLSLAAWMAFTLALVLPNVSYIPRVIADPFGWGWDLLGMRQTAWTWMPLEALPWIQVILLLAGLGLSIRMARAIAGRALREARMPGLGAIPVAAWLVGITWAFLGLFLA